MKILNILDWPTYRYYSDSHPLHRWKSKLRENGIKVNFYFNHLHRKLKESDYLFIHSRYFEKGWQNLSRRSQQNESELMDYLTEMKRYVGSLIWFDAADSTGSSDFPIIHLVDTFVKKQIHSDLTYYTQPNKLRVWLTSHPDPKENSFTPCNKLYLERIKVGWNIGLNDYRYYGYKMSRLSNYLSYSAYPSKYKSVEKERPYDLTFRGRLHNNASNVSWQRTEILKLMQSLEGNIATGDPVTKKKYLEELGKAKLCISPFGWGEVCYRDFESFISGSLLIKPDMSHLITYPNVYLSGETYLPVDWELIDLKVKIEYILDNYASLKQIAIRGQELFRTSVADGEAFVRVVKNILGIK